MFKRMNKQEKVFYANKLVRVFDTKMEYNWIFHEPYFEWATKKLMETTDGMSRFGKTYEEVYKECMEKYHPFPDGNTNTFSI